MTPPPSLRRLSAPRLAGAGLAGFSVLFVLNGLFHAGFARELIDTEMAAVGARAVGASGAWLPAFIHALNIAVICFFIARSSDPITVGLGARVGALVCLVGDGNWHLGNVVFFAKWSMKLLATDLPWHVLTGVLAGAVMGAILARAPVGSRAGQLIVHP